MHAPVGSLPPGVGSRLALPSNLTEPWELERRVLGSRVGLPVSVGACTHPANIRCPREQILNSKKMPSMERERWRHTEKKRERKKKNVFSTFCPRVPTFSFCTGTSIYTASPTPTWILHFKEAGLAVLWPNFTLSADSFQAFHGCSSNRNTLNLARCSNPWSGSDWFTLCSPADHTGLHFLWTCAIWAHWQQARTRCPSASLFPEWCSDSHLRKLPNVRDCVLLPR